MQLLNSKLKRPKRMSTGCRELFEEKDNADQSSYVHAILPFVHTYEGPNMDHDYYLREVYRMIHKLGTKETRTQIEQMKVLQ
jgi:hypothetical protein